MAASIIAPAFLRARNERMSILSSAWIAALGAGEVPAEGTVIHSERLGPESEHAFFYTLAVRMLPCGTFRLEWWNSARGRVHVGDKLLHSLDEVAGEFAAFKRDYNGCAVARLNALSGGRLTTWGDAAC